MRSRRSTLLLWAGREILMQPGAALLMALALGLLTTMLAAGLLLSQALTAKTVSLLEAGPDLVVRRIGAGGWQPIPVAAAAEGLAIPGIIGARCRIWGTARMNETVVSVVAGDDVALGRSTAFGTIRPPLPGEAVVGRGIGLPADDAVMPLTAADRIGVRAVHRFPAESDLFTHDLVMLHPRDARRLLNLPDDTASDLALEVFHPEEAEALLPEIFQAFPWPVHIATRADASKHYAAAFGRRGGLGALLYLPAALAMILLVAVIVRQQIGDRGRVGLLKALGWTSGDIVAFQVAKATLVSLPAIAAGMIAAYGLVYGPSQSWVGFLFLGWQETAPLMGLDAGYAAPVFLEVAGMLLAPFLAAVLWSSLRMAAADPQDLLDRGA